MSDGLSDFSGEHDPRRQRWRGPVATGVVAVVIGTGVVLGYQHWDSRAAAALHEASEGLEAVTGELTEALARAQSTLEASAERVTNPQTREDLASAISAASAVGFTIDPTGSRSERTISTRELASTARDQMSALTTAAAAVDRAVASWGLGEARAALVAAIEAANTALANSEHTIADNAVREALAALIAAAPADAQPDGDETVEELTAAAGRTWDEISGLESARQAVLDAQNAWQVEQDRVAVELAGRSPSKAGSRPGSTSAPSLSAAKPPAARSNADTAIDPKANVGSQPSAGSDSSPWVDTSTGADLCWVLDTQGNAREC